MFCGRVGAKDTFVIGAKLLREGKDVPSTGSGLKKNPQHNLSKKQNG